MRIAMIGTGYVGLVSGACFAEFGVDVTCVDKDEAKIECLKRNEIPIYEPGLDQLVVNSVKAGRLAFTTELKDAVAEADGVFIAVVSGFDRPADYCRSHEAGCDLHLTKPVDPEHLQHILAARKKEKHDHDP